MLSVLFCAASEMKFDEMRETGRGMTAVPYKISQ